LHKALFLPLYHSFEENNRRFCEQSSLNFPEKSGDKAEKPDVLHFQHIRKDYETDFRVLAFVSK